MYVPDHFALGDVGECHALMRANPFATLVGHSAEEGLVATHLPTVLKPDAAEMGTIEAHLGRANGHWRMFEDGGEALLIFSGPDAYIRPGWYPSKAEAGKVVPTWNYAAVHAYGRVEVMTDPAWLKAHVAELSDQQEAGRAEPWQLADAPAQFSDAMLRGIVGVKITITRLDGKLKMSQNRSLPDREGVVCGLRAMGGENEQAVADLVAENMASQD